MSVTTSIALRTLLSVGLVVATAAACAESAAPPSGPIRPGSADAPREVNVILRDYLFEPTPIRPGRGETVRFNVVNGGLLPHEFVLGDAAVQAAWASAEAIATSRILAATAPPVSLPPECGRTARLISTSGQSGSVVYRVPEEGAAARSPATSRATWRRAWSAVVEYVAPAAP